MLNFSKYEESSNESIEMLYLLLTLRELGRDSVCQKKS